MPWKAIVLRLHTAQKPAVLVLAYLAMCVLAFSGCATHSRRTYGDTVSTIRSMCRTHDVTTRDATEIDRPVFGFTEEGGADQDRWEVEFSEGHPKSKADLAFPKTTRISVIRQAGGQADYSVRCYDGGLKIDTRNMDREAYWRARVECFLVSNAPSR